MTKTLICKCGGAKTAKGDPQFVASELDEFRRDHYFDCCEVSRPKKDKQTKKKQRK